MKKILVSLFLLVFGLYLVGCVHSTYGYQFHFCVDGGNGTISIETSSSFNPDVKLCIDVEDMCELDCTEESYFVELTGGENGSREITFIATPNTGYRVKEWLFNGEIVDGNKTNSFTAIVTSEEDYVGVIAVRFEETIIMPKVINDFLIGFNPNSVVLSDGKGSASINKDYADFSSQLFFDEFSQIEVTMIEDNDDYQMHGIDVNYHITFNNSFDDFVSVKFYVVIVLDDDKVTTVYYGRLKCFSNPSVNYQFAINKDMFYEIVNYFFNDTELESLFYSLQESFENGFLTHEDLQQIANLNNNSPFNPVEINKDIATLIIKDFCEMHNTEYEENGGSVRCFGDYNGYYAVMVDGCGIEYTTAIDSEVVDGITFIYGSSQHILLWKYHE